jgi:hypothetical protein
VSLEVEVSGQLLPDRPRRLTLSPDREMTVAELVLRLGLDAEHVGLVVINGRQGGPNDRVPVDGRICFYPHLTGG